MADRVQVYTREGQFVKEFVFTPPGTKRGDTGSRGVAGSVNFSADKDQKYLYVGDMKNNTIWFVNRADGKVLDYDCAAAAACSPSPARDGCR